MISKILEIVLLVSSAFESVFDISAVHSAFTGVPVVVSCTLISGADIHSACTVVVSSVHTVG